MEVRALGVGALAVVAAWSATLHAADLVVFVSAAHDAPVADAVIGLRPHDASAAPAAPAPATKTIDQKNETFLPYVEVFRPGDSVVFRNSDQTRHHVYSFAPARQFEFVLTPGESSAPLRLENAGAIAVGCNIHDHMITYLYVSDAPWSARSGADGRAQIAALPPGDYDVSVWHPQLRPGQTPPTQSLHVDAASAAPTLRFALSLLPDPRRAADREHVDY
jgi:plastocyanin